LAGAGKKGSKGDRFFPEEGGGQSTEERGKPLEGSGKRVGENIYGEGFLHKRDSSEKKVFFPRGKRREPLTTQVGNPNGYNGVGGKEKKGLLDGHGAALGQKKNRECPGRSSSPEAYPGGGLKSISSNQEANSRNQQWKREEKRTRLLQRGKKLREKKSSGIYHRWTSGWKKHQKQTPENCE